jgi:hypothetical protein
MPWYPSSYAYSITCGKLKIYLCSHVNRGAPIGVWCDLARLYRDKTLYRHLYTNRVFAFFLLFSNAGGLADLIHSTLLLTHKLSLILELFAESSCSVIVFFDLSVQERKHGPTLSRRNARPRHLDLFYGSTQCLGIHVRQTLGPKLIL